MSCPPKWPVVSVPRSERQRFSSTFNLYLEDDGANGNRSVIEFELLLAVSWWMTCRS
jgi:hypothetical protein